MTEKPRKRGSFQDAGGFIPEIPSETREHDSRSWDALTQRGWELFRQYEASKVESCLKNSIECYREATSLNLPDNGHAGHAFRGLARTCFAWYMQVKDTTYMDESITNLQTALKLSPCCSKDHSSTFSDLAQALRMRFDHLRDHVDLDLAILNNNCALRLKPPGRHGRASILVALANNLRTRSELVDKHTDLDEAISILEFTLGAERCCLGEHIATLRCFAATLKSRFELFHDAPDLGKAVCSLETALDLVQPGTHGRASIVSDLAAALNTCFGRSAERTDLDKAVALLQNALSAEQCCHQEHYLIISDLASALQTRFEHFKDRTDLDEAIITLENIVKWTPSEISRPSLDLNSLGFSFKTRFEHFGDESDLTNAIINFQGAVELTALGHADEFSGLNNLAYALQKRFEVANDSSDLDAAITNYQRALQCIPSDDPFRPNLIKNLTFSLLARFDYAGNGADLDEIVDHSQIALKLVSIGDPSYPPILHRFATTLRKRFKLSGDAADLEKAIVTLKKALELTPPDHPAQSLIATSLSGALEARFGHSNNRADLDEAIVTLRSTFELSSGNCMEAFFGFKSLGTVLHTRFEKFGDDIDLHDSIAAFKTALVPLPPDRLDRSASLTTLAVTLWSNLGEPARYIDILQDPSFTYFSRSCSLRQASMSTSTQQDAQVEILDMLEEATLGAISGPLVDRLQASLTWTHAALGWSDPSVLRAYQAALGLWETWVTSGSSLESRHLRLSSESTERTRTLAAECAAFAITSGQVELALEMLEQGRNVLLTQAGRYRTTVEDLELVDPNLAEKFIKISAKLDKSIMTLDDSTPKNWTGPTMDAVAAYHGMHRKWNHVVQQIRALEGFSDFLKSTPFARLQAAATGGPIVVLNFSLSRSDAIIVRPNNQPFVVRLPSHAIPNFVAGLSRKAHHATSNTIFKGLLKDIWDSITEPVVKVLLEDIKLPRGSRIWWCPTGASSHLPLHAAGDYTQTNKILPDIFVSSYTPTLAALLRASQKRPCEISSKQNVLVIGQPNTPGQAELPSINLEIEKIQALVEDTTVLNESYATRDSVLKAMPLHPWLHLACHGHVKETQPFRSNFSLHDGPLTLLDVTKQVLPQADLAFLSACHSAEGNRARPDEALHLAAGMQFAGFKSVVGTLWAVRDVDGADVAETFYSSMLGKGRPKAKSTAHAVHRAAGELRMRPDVSYSRWACFVHYGC